MLKVSVRWDLFSIFIPPLPQEMITNEEEQSFSRYVALGEVLTYYLDFHYLLLRS